MTEPNTKTGSIISIPLSTGKFGVGQIVEQAGTPGVFWLAAYAETFASGDLISAELLESLVPKFFVDTTDALLYHKIWKVKDRSDNLATDYRPAFRELIMGRDVYVVDVFTNRRIKVEDSDIPGLPNQFSRSPAGVASVIARYPTREDWNQDDEELLIKPEWDVRTFFGD